VAFIETFEKNYYRNKYNNPLQKNTSTFESIASDSQIPNHFFLSCDQYQESMLKGFTLPASLFFFVFACRLTSKKISLFTSNQAVNKIFEF